jgi:hypothetical protein
MGQLKREARNFAQPARTGEIKSTHETIRATDLKAAIWKFMMKATSLWDYVPERYRKTDAKGHWIGRYDSHAEMFIPEYTPDACVSVFVKEGPEWKLVDKIFPYKAGCDK